MEQPAPIKSVKPSDAPPVISPPAVGSPPPIPNTVLLASFQQSGPPAKKRIGRRLRQLPWPVWIVLAITLPVLLIFGSAAAGIAILGGAFGLPLLLVAFLLGLVAVGSITLVKSLRKNPVATSHIASVVAQIVRDESLRQVRSELRKAMTTEPVEPWKRPLFGDEAQWQQQLLAMDPFEFERHVMGFFQEKGLFAWVTRRSNDAGVDGFARHRDGLIVVQCKRNAPNDPVGRPVVQQFKGVVEENEAVRGYIVTTSYFTAGANESASKNNRLRLIDMAGLIAWHKQGMEI
jgi:hypothetical protein